MQHRIASLLVFALVVAIGAIAAVTWYRPESSNGIVVAEATEAVPPAREMTAAPMPVSDPVPPSPAADKVAQWIADSSAGDAAKRDAAKRAAAITALAEAPRAQAVPVLRRILTDGEPQVDRSLALRSLRDLALNQGDADGAIREAVRNAIYHGDDQMNMAEVQETLDIIEESAR